MKQNQLKWGAILSYIQMAMNVVIGLIYTPVMLRLLGQNEYGLYNTVSSTISMLGILNLGFGASYIRYYSKYKAKDDRDAIAKLNGLFLIIFTVIGIIALVCGLFLTQHLNLLFDSGLTEREYQTAKILMLLLTLRLAISFPLSVFTNIISAHERFIFLRICGMGSIVLSPLLSLLLLLAGYRSVAMVMISVVLGTLFDLICLFYTIVCLHQKFVFYHFEKGIVRSLFSYTFFIAINLIIDQINWNIDKMILARFKGTAMVAVYSVGYSLYSYYMSFSTNVSGVFIPRIHKIVSETEMDSKEQKAQLTKLFIKVGRIQFLILGLIASGLVFFGRQFIVYFWAGKEYEQSYEVMLLLVLPASIALIQNLGIEIQRAENRHHFRSIVYFFMALVNLGLSIVLCQRYGAIGSASGTALALILANGFIMNIYYHKHCNIDILLFWKNILRMVVGLVIPVAIGILINYFMECTTVFTFVLGVLLYIISYIISMWLLGMNSEEKNLILHLLRR